MNHRTNHSNHQNNDQLDAILLAEFSSAEQLRPSSGFVLSVMDAIYEEATAPPPIPFPWKRVLPGGIAILCSLVALVVLAMLHPSPAPGTDYAFTLPVFIERASTLCWIALAFVLTLISVSSSLWLVNRRHR